MRARSVAIFANPRAGSGAGRSEIPRLIELLRDDSIEADVITDPSRLRQWCLQRRDQHEHDSSVVVAAGGDGTITLAASLIGDEPISDAIRSPFLLPMPLGTENLLAKHYGHCPDAATVRRTIFEGRVETLDLGMVERSNSTSPAKIHPMLTMVSCGFDADVVRRVHLKRTGHIRRLSYLRPILKSIRAYSFPELTVTGLDEVGNIEQEIRCRWAMVFNLPRYAGGLAIEPDAIGSDGWLDVITFAGRGIIKGLGYVVGIHTGRHLKNPDIKRFQARRIRITSPQRVHYQIDGDYVGRLPIEIRLRPAAIRLLLPGDW